MSQSRSHQDPLVSSGSIMYHKIGYDLNFGPKRNMMLHDKKLEKWMQ